MMDDIIPILYVRDRLERLSNLDKATLQQEIALGFKSKYDLTKARAGITMVPIYKSVAMQRPPLLNMALFYRVNEVSSLLGKIQPMLECMSRA